MWWSGIAKFRSGMSTFLRRLFSSFARGGPGAGLLLLRVVIGLVLLSHAALTLRRGGSFGPLALGVVTGGAGILLLAGLWTPIAGDGRGSNCLVERLR